MDTLECLLTRRSVRMYKPDPIPRQELEEILAAAACAPSAVNLQPWYLAAICSPDGMAAFRDTMRQVAVKTRPELEERFPNHPQVIRETESFLVSLGGAPACVLVFLLKEDYPDRDNVLQSASAAVENLLLAAWAKGIGSCWMTAPVSAGFGPVLRDRFAPGKGELVAAVSLGYPDQTPRMPKRKTGRCVFL
ncbi:nitroreductase family protein [uncultured Intestinimonas sp.]|uniref:nitroreductase family protein n=1 Tax=uncultured Intestinimonas sp. TaxID=1689265 RepID=UPI0025DDFAB4|nr:nitroreductase family protein [uncultured Intestinimonas sp.]